jgi:hypothetical protein
MSNDNNCVQVIRIKFASLMELTKTFIDLLVGSSLLVGSIVLLSSASHLASIGTAGYAEDMARCSKLLLQTFRESITVKHGIIIMLNGTNSDELIRYLFELDGWLSNLNGLDSFPSNARKAALLALKNSGSGNNLCSPVRLRLPVSLTSFEKQTFLSNDWVGLPCTVEQINALQEKDIIDAFFKDLNDNFCFDYCTDVTIRRDGMLTRPVSRARKIVVIGASLAGRLSDALLELGESAVHIKMPSWMPNTTTVAAAMEELDNLVLDLPDDLIVFFNLDCAAYYARDEQGTLIPSRRLNEEYHVDGELVVAPKELFIKTLRVCAPLLQLHNKVRKVIFSPSPRYWLMTCCHDDEHVSNFLESTYEDDLFNGLDILRRQIKDFIFTAHLPNCIVSNPMQVFADNSSKTTSAEVRAWVKDIWGTDAVHPSKACFEKLAIYTSQLDNPTKKPSVAVTPRQPPPIKRLKWVSEAPETAVAPLRTFTRGGSRGSGWRGRPWQRGRGYS